MIVGVDGGAGACAAIDDAAAMVVSTANASEGRVVVRMAVEGSGADSSVNRVRPSVLGKPRLVRSALRRYNPPGRWPDSVPAAYGARVKRDFLVVPDLTKPELISLLDLALCMKRGEYREHPLLGKTLGMLFAKSSTRTRVSFEVGAFQLGGHALFLSSRDIQLGRGEPIRDTARVLSRYVDGVMIRTFDQAEVEELARFATVPVINGLTDLQHPCQILADLLTVREALGGWGGKVVAWIGDGNNMAHSWLDAAGLLGFELRLACPKGYQPNAEIVARNRALTKIVLTTKPAEAARGAHVINTDVWASMGQEAEQEQRAAAFRGYLVDAPLMREADPRAIFLHCLPAHRGEEVSDDVIEGSQSRVWDEAENRLHVQKALMATLMGTA
jgi:ornithine carbamoyltransferase